MSAGKPEPEAGWTILFLIIFIGILGIAFWSVGKIPVLETLRWLRISEFWIVGLFTSSQDACMQWMRHVSYGDTNPSNDIVVWTNKCFGPVYLTRQDPKHLPDFFSLSLRGLGAVEMKGTYYYHWPFAILFAWCAIYFMYFSPRGRFKTRYTLENFIQVQARMWPVISPIVKFNPIKSSARVPGSAVPSKLPMFAEALSPEEWIAFHQIPIVNGVADPDATRRAFIMQLGPRWNGIDGQPPYIKALFAAFSLKGAQKREESDDILGRIALCWNEKSGFNLTSDLATEIRKIIRDAELGGKALEVANNHAWRTTAVIAALKWARTMGGVLAPAQFLWLRGTDRNLWYALNNVGRRSFHSEGAGAVAHFMSEQNAKKALPIPRVDTAVVTLNGFLASEKARPIPAREN